MNILIKPKGVPYDHDVIETFWRKSPGKMYIFDGTSHHHVTPDSKKELNRTDIEYILWCSGDIKRMACRKDNSDILWLASSVDNIRPTPKDDHEYLLDMLKRFDGRAYTALFKYFSSHGTFVTYDKKASRFKYKKNVLFKCGALFTTEHLEYTSPREKLTRPRENIIIPNHFNNRWTPAHYMNKPAIAQFKKEEKAAFFVIMGFGIAVSQLTEEGKRIHATGLTDSNLKITLSKCKTQVYSNPQVGSVAHLFKLEAGDVVYKISIEHRDSSQNESSIFPSPEEVRNFITRNINHRRSMIFWIFRFDLMTSDTTFLRLRMFELSRNQRGYIINCLRLDSAGSLNDSDKEQLETLDDVTLLALPGVKSIDWHNIK